MDFPSTYESVRIARHGLVRYARYVGLAGNALEDFEIAIGEALANAAEHGHCDGSRFSVVAEVTNGALRVDVKDGGRGFENWDAAQSVKPMSNSPRGFGIFIMRTLMDRVEYSEGGSRIRLSKNLPIAASAEARREA